MKIFVSAFALTAALASAAVAFAEGAEAPKPYATKVMSCDRIVLTWMSTGFLSQTPANVVTVEPKAGTTGLKVFVDRSRGAISAVESWEAIGGTTQMTSLPGNPRIDYVNCHPDTFNLGGIYVEYFDAKDWTP